MCGDSSARSRRRALISVRDSFTRQHIGTATTTSCNTIRRVCGERVRCSRRLFKYIPPVCAQWCVCWLAGRTCQSDQYTARPKCGLCTLPVHVSTVVALGITHRKTADTIDLHVLHTHIRPYVPKGLSHSRHHREQRCVEQQGIRYLFQHARIEKPYTRARAPSPPTPPPLSSVYTLKRIRMWPSANIYVQTPSLCARAHASACIHACTAHTERIQFQVGSFKQKLKAFNCYMRTNERAIISRRTTIADRRAGSAERFHAHAIRSTSATPCRSDNTAWKTGHYHHRAENYTHDARSL